MTSTPFYTKPVGALRHTAVSTRFGDFTIVADDAAVTAVHYPDTPPEESWGEPVTVEDHPLLAEAAAQLRDFLAGERTTFTVPLRPFGTTFQLQVWAALLRIPYGQTLSYTEQAVLIGRPQAVRAVGAANGRNPIPVFIPCHRVIGSKGSLTGYAGGVNLKARLLDLESGQATLA